MKPKKTVALIILDGWGLAAPGPGNAVTLANTPTFDRIWKTCPSTTLEASGQAVGLPEGQMGNSEVGHSNLGAGRVVYQPSTLISKQIREGIFFENSVFLAAMQKARGSRLHLMGLVSDGGVHSQLTHLLALLEMAKQQELEQVYVHAFTDGRDTTPTSGAGFLKVIQEKLDQLEFPQGGIATITGRYWAMDRDKRWERTEKAYRALCFGEGQITETPAPEALQQAYQSGETDEFITPLILHPKGLIQPQDVVIFFNFRPDRARQLSHALSDPDFSAFERGQALDLEFTMMTQYESTLKGPVAYPPQARLPNILGQVVSDAGYRQFRCAETEKYAHVTYFFNNGKEDPFPGEDWQLIPSPKVATYDLQPEMSVRAVTETTAQRIRSGDDAFVLVNLANPDMVGHTGVIEAAVRAVEAADRGLGVLLEALGNGQALVVADHGNAECMLQPDGTPHTAHTTNPVPLIHVGGPHRMLVQGGKLGDVAPTILACLGIPQPAEMTGQCLIKS